MNRDLLLPLCGLDGKPNETEPKTIKDACVLALSCDYRDENLRWDEKYKRYKLLRRIEASSREQPAQLESDDVVMLKLVAGKRWPPLYVGQIVELLEKDP